MSWIVWIKVNNGLLKISSWLNPRQEAFNCISPSTIAVGAIERPTESIVRANLQMSLYSS